MTNALRLNEQEHRTLHELQGLLVARGEEASTPVGALYDMEPQGLFAMLDGCWSEATASNRHRLGSTLAASGNSPASLLEPLYECLVQVTRLTDADPRVLLSIKGALVDLQAVLDGFATTSQANLRQALEMALNARIDLQQFARVASHDLKTPLATVANLCDEALDEFGEEIPIAARKLLGAARNRVFETSRAIDELLEGATDHYTASTNKKLSLETVLADAVRRLQLRFPQRAVVVEYPAHLPNVFADPVRLREALVQLFANAASRSSDQPVAEIKIDADASAGMCVLRISSNSFIAQSEQVEELFYPSFSATEGSGLALYFARLLIEQQGGQLWAETINGQGPQLLLSLRLDDAGSHSGH